MKTLIQVVASLLIVVAILITAGLFLPLGNITWGTVKTMPTNTIVVSGEAQSSEKNQVATFTAGVDAVDDDKAKAVADVNTKVEALIMAVKGFGIDAADIQTQNLSVFQEQEMYSSEGAQRSRPGQWRVNNSITIKLRDIEKASALTDLLTNSGATNVYGPSFTMEDTNDVRSQLLSQAVENARKKAELMIGGTGRSLGKVISISEGGTSGGVYPMFDRAMGMGGGAPVEPGSTEVTASVTVVFELK